MPHLIPRITAIGTAVPAQDIHEAFIGWALGQLADPGQAALFERMARRSGIDHRYAVLPASPGSPVKPGGFYARETLPQTSERMRLYEALAPGLALEAVAALGGKFDPSAISHIVVASCTGFCAPGIDQIVAKALGLDSSVERLLIGFMGCYAAVTALRTARHIVRSEPGAQVLVITVELSSLHLQPVRDMEPLLAMLQFGDGAAAALVSAQGVGLTIEAPFSATLPDSDLLIRWSIGDQGFAMHLSGEVPGRIAQALRTPEIRALLDPNDTDAWAVHAGGKSILDAVAHGLDITPDRLDMSRAVLADYGNMSSATLMFALARFSGDAVDNGVALAFGPGLAAEGFRFRTIG